MTAERYQAIFEFPVIRYYQTLGFDFDREPFEVVGTEFIQRYEQRRHECTLRPEAVTVLDTLRQRGLGQSILSAYKETTLEELLAFHRVSGYFDHVLGLSDHYAADKSGRGLALMERLDLDPKSILLVGDTTHDVEVAEKMGAQVTLIASGNQSLAKLQACDVPIIGNLEELLARIIHIRE